MRVLLVFCLAVATTFSIDANAQWDDYETWVDGNVKNSSYRSCTYNAINRIASRCPVTGRLLQDLYWTGAMDFNSNLGGLGSSEFLIQGEMNISSFYFNVTNCTPRGGGVILDHWNSSGPWNQYEATLIHEAHHQLTGRDHSLDSSGRPVYDSVYAAMNSYNCRETNYYFLRDYKAQELQLALRCQGNSNWANSHWRIQSACEKAVSKQCSSGGDRYVDCSSSGGSTSTYSGGGSTSSTGTSMPIAPEGDSGSTSSDDSDSDDEGEVVITIGDPKIVPKEDVM